MVMVMPSLTNCVHLRAHSRLCQTVRAQSFTRVVDVILIIHDIPCYFFCFGQLEHRLCLPGSETSSRVHTLASCYYHSVNSFTRVVDVILITHDIPCYFLCFGQLEHRLCLPGSETSSRVHTLASCYYHSVNSFTRVVDVILITHDIPCYFLCFGQLEHRLCLPGSETSSRVHTLASCYYHSVNSFTRVVDVILITHDIPCYFLCFGQLEHRLCLHGSETSSRVHTLASCYYHSVNSFT